MNGKASKSTIPASIESTLLYQGFETVDAADILHILNNDMGDHNLRFSTGLDVGDHAMFMSDELRVHVSQTRTPLEFDCLAGALASPAVQLTFPDAFAKIQNHRARIAISVSDIVAKEDVPEPSEHSGTLQGFPDTHFERKLHICKTLTRFMAVRNHPDAIHWGQSDQIISPQSFKLTTSNFDFPTPLYVHPYLFSSNEVINDIQLLGLTTYGAAHLIGREITFREAPVPFHWLQHRTVVFIDMIRQRGALIPDDETFGLNELEVIRVKHRASSQQHPQGSVELQLEQSDEFALEESPLPGSQPLSANDNDEGELDPANPIDQAIINQLNKTAQNMRTRQRVQAEARMPTAAAAGFGKRSARLLH